MAKPKSSVTLDALKEAAKGLSFTSETDAPLTPFAWPAGDPAAAVKKQAGGKGEVETMTLDAFFRAVPKEDKPQFDALATVLKRLLPDVKVYKVGDEAEKDVYIVGKASDGQLAGLKTTVVET